MYIKKYWGNFIGGSDDSLNLVAFLVDQKKDMGRTCVGPATAHSRDVANRSAVWSAFSRSPK